MTDVVLSLNIPWLDQKPIHLNLVETPVIILSVCVLLWLGIDRHAGDRLARWFSRVDALPHEFQRRIALSLIAT